MKTIEKLIKLAAAVAAVAGVAFLVVKYFDAIKAWLQKLCPCCNLEEDFVDDAADAEFAPVEEEAPAEEPAEEAPVEEAPAVEDGAPVAEEADFEA